jgi:hypothetical protein
MHCTHADRRVFPVVRVKLGRACDVAQAGYPFQATDVAFVLCVHRLDVCGEHIRCCRMGCQHAEHGILLHVLVVERGRVQERRADAGHELQRAGICFPHFLCDRFSLSMLCEASTAFAQGNSTQAQLLLAEVSTATNNVVGAVQSVQQFCEAMVCVIIIMAFLVAGYMCYFRVHQGLVAVSQSAGSINEGSSPPSSPLTLRQNVFERVSKRGDQLMLRIVGTVIVVFLMFLLRASFAIMNALSEYRDVNTNGCGLCDASCQDGYVLMANWLDYTPEFQITAMVLSSPLVSLWGMTCQRARKLLLSPQPVSPPGFSSSDQDSEVITHSHVSSWQSKLIQRGNHQALLQKPSPPKCPPPDACSA